MNLGFIIQRFGEDVTGGAELHCRLLTQRLKEQHKIDILTTCAKDYQTWNNHYAQGEQELNGITIRRFKNTQPRNKLAFDSYSTWLYNNPHTLAHELAWMDLQGPVSPSLIRYLQENHQRYDKLIFYTYLYPTSYYGLHVCPQKSLLVPCTHDEPPIYLDIFKQVFHLPRGIYYLTPWEREFTEHLFGIGHIPSAVLGIGVKPPDDISLDEFRARHDLSSRYLLYAGRLDEGKGVGDLIRYFLGSKKELALDIDLVLIGSLSMSIPKCDDIKYLGMVSEHEKWQAIAGARAIIVPSAYESLSILLIEAMSLGVPVLVNGASKVLVGHCTKSNAGLWYSDYSEFKAALSLLLNDGNLYSGLSENGMKYARDNFVWEKVIGSFNRLLENTP